jgi:hypothetical protein
MNTYEMQGIGVSIVFELLQVNILEAILGGRSGSHIKWGMHNNR